MATRFSWAHKCYPTRLRSKVNCFLYYKMWVFFKSLQYIKSFSMIILLHSSFRSLYLIISRNILFVICCTQVQKHQILWTPHLNVVQNLFLQGHLSSTVGSKKQDCVYFILKHSHMLSQPPTHKTTTNIGQVHVCMPWPWEQCRACLYEALRHGICGI